MSAHAPGMAALHAAIETRYRESVHEAPRLSDSARALDVMHRLTASAEWTFHRTLPRRRGIEGATVAVHWTDGSGGAYSSSFTGSQMLDLIRDLRRRLVCGRCGQLRPEVQRPNV